MAVEGERSRLESWKAIAAHFGRGERTVRRWEAELGLPVRRMPGAAKGRVYAVIEDLEAWRAGRPPSDGAPEHRAADREVEPLAAPSKPEARVSRPGAFNRWRWGWATLACLLLTGVGVFAVRAGRPERLESAPYAAQKLYVEGAEAWKQRTPASLNAALDDFNAALKIDPNYAEAWLGLAKTYSLMREYTFMPESQAYPLARDAARKALALDNRLAEAHAALGFVDYWGFWKAREAQAEFRRALSLDPSSSVAHHWYATFLLNRGQPLEALAEIDRAAALDPSSRSVAADRGYILFLAGRQRDGLASLADLEKRDESFPSPHVYLSRIYLALGRDADFLKEAALAARTTNMQPGIDAARRGLEMGGHAGMLGAMLEDSLERFRSGSGSAIEVADAYARSGQSASAVLWLAKSAERREPGFVTLEGNHDYDPLRSTPAFRALAANIG